MQKTLCDMFIKQTGSYERLLDIARMTYPDAKPIKSKTYYIEDNPILTLTFETEGFVESQANKNLQ